METRSLCSRNIYVIDDRICNTYSMIQNNHFNNENYIWSTAPIYTMLQHTFGLSNKQYVTELVWIFLFLILHSMLLTSTWCDPLVINSLYAESVRWSTSHICIFTHIDSAVITENKYSLTLHGDTIAVYDVVTQSSRASAIMIFFWCSGNIQAQHQSHCFMSSHHGQIFLSFCICLNNQKGMLGSGASLAESIEVLTDKVPPNEYTDTPIRVLKAYSAYHCFMTLP